MAPPPNPEVVFHALAGLMGTGTLIAGWYASTFNTLGRAIEEARLGEPGEVREPGYYLLRGKVRGTDLLETPIDSKKVVQYHYKVSEEDLIHTKNGSYVVARLLKDEDRRIPFELVGPKGKLLVYPAKARMEGVELRNNTMRPGSSGMIATRRESSDRYGSGGAYHYSEDARHEVVAIPEEAEVFVLGPVSADPATGEMVMKHDADADGPFVVMTTRLDKVAEREARHGGIYWAICGVLGFLTLVLAVVPALVLG